MPQRIEFQGTVHEFPDGFSQEQISKALKTFVPTTTPPVDLSGIENVASDALSFGNPQTTPEPTPHPVSNWAVIADALTSKLPSNVFGAVGDLYNIPLQAIGSGMQILRGEGDQPYQPIPNPIPGSEYFRNNVFKPVADESQYTRGQRLGSNILTLGGEGLLGGAGLASRAKYASDAARAVPAVVEDLNLPAVFNNFLKPKRQAVSDIGNVLSNPGAILDEAAAPYATRPVAQTLTDAVTGAGAGAGLTFAEETDQGPIGTLFSTLLGGLSAAPTARMVENAARAKYAAGESELVPGFSRRAVDDVRSIVNEETVNKKTGETFGPLVTDRKRALQNINQSLADADELGIADPTLGPASGDVGLSMLEVRQRVKNPQPFAERDQDVRTGIASKFGEAFGDPAADITAPQRASSELIARETGARQNRINELSDLETQQQQQLRSLQEQGKEIPAEIEARRGAEGRASAGLNTQLRSALDERTQAKNQKFEESAKGAYVDANTLANLVREVNAEAPKLAPDARLPDYIMRGIRKFIPQPGTLEGPGSTAGMIPADEVLKLRMYLDTEINSLRQKGEFTKADTLQSFKSKINQTIELDPQFKEANEFYKTEYAPFFRSPYGKQYRDIVQRGDSTGRADAENIASFFLDRTTSAADDMKRIIEIAPDKQAADNAVEMYFDAKLARTTLNPKTIRNFIADNASILPDNVKTKYEGIVKSMMDNTAAQNKALDDLNVLKKTIREAETDLRKTEQSLTSGPFGKMSRFNSNEYVDSILSAKDSVRQIAEIKAQIGDNKEAMAGFKEATVRWLMRQVKGKDASGTNLNDTDVTGRPVVYSKLTATLDNNREVLSKIFTPEEMNTLNQMQKILSRQGNLARRATTGSDTAEKLTQSQQEFEKVIEAVLKVKFGMLKGAGLNKIMKDVRNFALGPSMRPVEAERLITQMALDPRVAKHILEVTPLKINNGKWFSELNALMATQEATAAEENE